jgi:hypothetical protein
MLTFNVKQDDVSAEVERFFGRKPNYEQIQFHCALAALQMGKVRFLSFALHAETFLTIKHACFLVRFREV